MINITNTRMNRIMRQGRLETKVGSHVTDRAREGPTPLLKMPSEVLSHNSQAKHKHY